MEYLITPPKQTNWHISESDLIDHLFKKWLNIQIKEITNPDDFYLFEGFRKVGSAHLTYYIYLKNQIVTL